MATYTRDALSPIAASLPLRNGGCTAVLSNRIVKGAMTECLADPATHDPNLQHGALYRRWAQETRAGGLITGNVQVGRAAATVCSYSLIPFPIILEQQRSIVASFGIAAVFARGGGAVTCRVFLAGKLRLMGVPYCVPAAAR